MHPASPHIFPAITMQASFIKLLNQPGLVTLQELLKAFPLALPAVLLTCETTPKLWIPPPQKLKQKPTL